MRFLTLAEVLFLHEEILKQSGGGAGIRDFGAIQSSIAMPRMSFGGNDLYPGIVEKAGILGYSIIMNHPFIDGNKRTGHAAMEVFLMINGHEIDCDVDEQERIVLTLAAGNLGLEKFYECLRTIVKCQS